jgi:hypothetical protein
MSDERTWPDLTVSEALRLGHPANRGVPAVEVTREAMRLTSVVCWPEHYKPGVREELRTAESALRRAVKLMEDKA